METQGRRSRSRPAADAIIRTWRRSWSLQSIAFDNALLFRPVQSRRVERGDRAESVCFVHVSAGATGSDGFEGHGLRRDQVSAELEGR